VQCGIFPVAWSLDRSKVCVVGLGREGAATLFASAQDESRKKLFFTSEARADAHQAKEEWIGRTETMQFQFVACVLAPLKGANCTSEFVLHECVAQFAGLRPRD
jgi:uncharacterized protein (DUF169 family)